VIHNNGSSRFVVGTARRWAQAVAFRYFNRYILKLSFKKASEKERGYPFTSRV